MMRFDLRKAGALALLALLIGPAALLAQDAPLTVAGSGVVAPVFQALADRAGVEADVQVTGTNAGIQALCGGEAQVALATRALSVEEEVSCAAAGIDFVEVLAGHNIIAFVTRAESELPQCVTSGDLAAVLAPSAQGQSLNWSQINAAFPDTPVSVYGPDVETALYALADNFIEGVGLRSDLKTADAAGVADAVAADAGALGIVSLAEAQSLGDAVRILDVDAQSGTGCAAATADNVESRTYPAADSLYIYAAADAVGSEPLASILGALTGEDAATLVADVGFTPASAAAYGKVADALADGTTGRLFSLNVSDFEVPSELAGAITIAGSPTIVRYFRDLTSEFTAQYPAVTTETTFLGSTSGIGRLCAGTADISVVDTDVTDELLADCAAADIAVETVDLGSEAVVLIASADADYLSCLTTEQIATTWQASETAVSTWSQVSDEFDDAPVYLFAAAEGANSSADLLMIETTGRAQPLRVDITERNNDPLYRAAAVANGGSALAILSWPEYQSVLNAGQDGIQLVSVDGGDGCVEPSVATIADGSYALSRPVQLLVSQQALARPEVQALLWTTLADENYGLLQLADLVGIEFGDLPAQRAALQAQFDAATAAALTAPEVSTDESSEASAEATETADAEPTDEATESE